MPSVYDLNEFEYQDLVFKTVVGLHKRGLGLLKLACYTKEGIGAWRHLLFASQSFPVAAIFSNLPSPFLFGSFRDNILMKHSDARNAGDLFIEQNPELARACQGEDYRYTAWFSAVAEIQFWHVFQMERPDYAKLGALRIYTSYERDR